LEEPSEESEDDAPIDALLSIVDDFSAELVEVD
jgi:hypothetical protein